MERTHVEVTRQAKKRRVQGAADPDPMLTKTISSSTCFVSSAWRRSISAFT